MNNKIQFFSEDTDFILKHKTLLRSWISNSIRSESKNPWYINFIFCSDNYLLELNKNYLNHDTFTDVITFPYSEDEKTVTGDIYISVERVSDNALNFGEAFEDELHRVMIHGVLHLIGYDDKTTVLKNQMTDKEEQYLEILRKD